MTPKTYSLSKPIYTLMYLKTAVIIYFEQKLREFLLRRRLRGICKGLPPMPYQHKVSTISIRYNMMLCSIQNMVVTSCRYCKFSLLQELDVKKLCPLSRSPSVSIAEQKS
ncbi:hypothetical protein AVEN_212170-1 [Araneus ventricosus]|uniref:Uncharacterized protein n=1 Tax=Araneus ventricosus TaxID=182803 RepID=A0A4Y2S6A0_ARAVE|nr:hypothetical protein AVEN_212170-1 [Araneus ventricosus]